MHSRIDDAPYGEAHHRWAGDINHDGAVDGIDGAAFTAMLSGGKKDIDHPTDYEVDYDLWKGGETSGASEVNSLDHALWSVTWNGLSALPAGDVWTSKTFASAGAYGYRGSGNTIGFTGRRYDEETGLYLARFRSFAPASGGWVRSGPVIFKKPRGVVRGSRHGVRLGGEGGHHVLTERAEAFTAGGAV